MFMDSTSLPEQPRLLALEVGGTNGLERRVRVELDERRTILVGRNGAGKSLVADAIVQGAMQATRIYLSHSALTVGSFRCEIWRPQAPGLGYEYQCQRASSDRDDHFPDTSGLGTLWKERCWELEGEELWKVENGALTLHGQPSSPFPPGTGRLMLSSLPPDAQQVKRLLEGIRLIPPGVARQTARQTILFQGGRGRGDSFAVLLGRQILHYWQSDRPTFEELVEILRTLSLARDVTIQTYKAQSTENTNPEVSAVLLDGVNIGLLSDGTLRALHIVLALLDQETTCLIIEEPESAIHPGLLDKLLNLFESYSMDRQFIITTHSPLVVDWCKPDQLRLVEHRDKTTTISAFEDARKKLIDLYLHDYGTLSDYLYKRSED